VRFVTYRNITREDIEKAVEIVGSLMAARPWAMAEATTA
jgi:hypothetical protein